MRNVHIVLVEDNPADIFLVRKALETQDLDFELTCFTDGEAALESLSKIGSQLPDLILLDLHLPKMEGIAILRAIRTTPGIEDVPVVVLTSSELPSDKQSASEIGAAGYIRKPTTLNQFLQEVGSEVKAVLGCLEQLSESNQLPGSRTTTHRKS